MDETMLFAQDDKPQLDDVSREHLQNNGIQDNPAY
jgi:hypothetical protein